MSNIESSPPGSPTPIPITIEEVPPTSTVPSEPLVNSDPSPVTTAKAVAQKGLTRACPHTRKSRNLVVNLDGTGNQFGEKSTNVVELCSRIKRDDRHLVYYDSGIGTYARPSYRSWGYIKQALDHGIDSAIAWNFEKFVHAAYKWLSEHYRSGDRIFIFGFSRGAYAARVIAGMIEKVGLILRGNERQIPFAYELYTSITSNEKRATATALNTSKNKGTGPRIGGNSGPVNPPMTTQPPVQVQNKIQSPSTSMKENDLCEEFKRTLCHKGARVHFIGAWDTVSSIGILRGKSLPETVSGMGHVCHFRHALALDERRAKFQPEYVNGGQGPQSTDKLGDVKEVWFAGSHSDIGGGNVNNPKLRNFTASLRWMAYEAMSCGLEMVPYEGTWEPIKVTESLTWRWKPLEWIPFGSLKYTGNDTITYRPHFGRPRLIQPGQKIHQSVLTHMPGQATFNIESSNKSDTETSSDSQSLSELETAHSSSQLGDTTGRNIETARSTETSWFNKHLNRMLNYVASKPQVNMGPPDRPYTPKARLPPNLGFKDWNEFFARNFDDKIKDSKDSAMLKKGLAMLEKDPFDDVSHTLQLLRTTSEGEPDWDQIQAPVSALGTVLNAPTHAQHRLQSLQEVPEAGPILMETLSKLNGSESQRMNIDLWKPLVRLLVHARTVPRNRRKKTQDLRKWECVQKLPVPWSDWQRVLRSFGDGRLESYSMPRHLKFTCVSFAAKSPSQVILTTINRHDDTIDLLVQGKPGERPSSVWHGSGRKAALSNDGSLVVIIGDGDDPMTIIKTDTQAQVITEPCADQHDDESGVVTMCCVSPDHQVIASAHYNGVIKLWRRTKDRWEVFDNFASGTDELDGCFLHFSADASRLAFESGTVKVCTIATHEILELEGSRRSVSLAWHPFENALASGDYNGGLTTWNGDQAEAIHLFTAHDDDLRTVAFRPDGLVFATGDNSGSIRAWTWGTWEILWDFRLHDTRVFPAEYVISLAFSPDGKRLLSGGDEGWFRIWDVEVDPPK